MAIGTYGSVKEFRVESSMRFMMGLLLDVLVETHEEEGKEGLCWVIRSLWYLDQDQQQCVVWRTERVKQTSKQGMEQKGT